MANREKCITYLEQHKDTGVSLKQLMDDMKLSKSAAYTLISHIRCDMGIPVKLNRKDMKYFIHQGKKKPAEKKKRAYVRHVIPVEKILVDLDLPFDMPKEHAKIHPKLKGDFIDYIGQAAFFYWCAEACIRKEKLKESLSR
jgi:hypothetical protein